MTKPKRPRAGMVELPKAEGSESRPAETVAAEGIGPAAPAPAGRDFTPVAFAAPDPEKAALLARVAELAALIAARETDPEPAAEAEYTAPFPAVERYWQVSVQHAPTWIVPAPDEANAVEEYKRRTGMIAAGYPPEVHEVPAPLYEEQEQRRREGK